MHARAVSGARMLLLFRISPPMPAEPASAAVATDRNKDPSKIIMAAQRPDLRR
jgi:hypothetical protein